MDNIEINKMTNEILKELFHQIMIIQEKFVEDSSNIKLSRTEIHIIEIVGDDPKSILTDIASKLYITKATASVSIGRLVEKGLVNRIPLENDKRKHALVLSADGLLCYNSHATFHNELIEALTNDFNLNEKKELARGLKQMLEFFKEHY